jgi:hypothetical protein
MTLSLSAQDIKTLRYQCRPGIIFSLMVLIIIPASLFTFIKGFNVSVSLSYIIIALILDLIISFIIAFLLTRKFLIDIRSGVKRYEIKKISGKESKLDTEAGSGTLYIEQKMKTFDTYYLIIENVRYRVEKEMFGTCLEGDEVVFFYAPRSNFRLSMEARSSTFV